MSRFLLLALFLPASCLAFGCATAIGDQGLLEDRDGAETGGAVGDSGGSATGGGGLLTTGGSTSGAGGAATGGGASTGGAPSTGGAAATGGSATGGSPAATTGDCSAIPAFELGAGNKYAADAEVTAVCAGSTACVQGNPPGASGETYAFKCKDQYNCGSQDPATTNWAQPPWQLSIICE